jgi:hypothetical protein
MIIRLVRILDLKQQSFPEESNKKNYWTEKKIGACVVLAMLLFAGIIVMGCTNPLTSNNSGFQKLRPDPETGIVNWMSAVNEKNIPRLYALSPDFVRRNVTEKEFIESNVGNPILQPGFIFTNYEIINKTGEGNYARIKAILVATNSSISTNSSSGFPIFYNFILYYENGEWKAWTIPF